MNPGGDNGSESPINDYVRKIRSEELPRLAETLKKMVPYLDHEMFQVNLILDANIVMRELLWLARKRINAAAKTDLMEVLDCTVVRAFAPSFLIREIKTNIPEVAAEFGISAANLELLWRSYRKRISFVAVGGPARRGKWVDPKDAPYVRLQRKLQYPIVSLDPHLSAMGARVIHVQIFGPLRAYSRAAAIEYQLKVSGAVSAMLAAAIGEALLSTITRLPPILLWGALIAAVAALAHPVSRRKILDVAAAVLEGSALAGGAFLKAIDPLIQAHLDAQRRAELNLGEAQLKLAAPSSVSGAS